MGHQRTFTAKDNCDNARILSKQSLEDTTLQSCCFHLRKVRVQ